MDHDTNAFTRHEKHIQIRRHALRDFVVGSVFDVGDRLWILLSCEPEEDGHGNRLTLRKMTDAEEKIWGVMDS